MRGRTQSLPPVVVMIPCSSRCIPTGSIPTSRLSGLLRTQFHVRDRGIRDFYSLASGARIEHCIFCVKGRTESLSPVVTEVPYSPGCIPTGSIPTSPLTGLVGTQFHVCDSVFHSHKSKSKSRNFKKFDIKLYIFVNMFVVGDTVNTLVTFWITLDR